MPNIALLQREPERQIITDKLNNELESVLQENVVSSYTGTDGPENIEGT